jgi:hypothetical protein
MAAMADVKTNMGELCRELGVTRQTLFRYVRPSWRALREDGRRLLASRGRQPGPPLRASAKQRQSCPKGLMWGSGPRLLIQAAEVGWAGSDRPWSWNPRQLLGLPRSAIDHPSQRLTNL